VAVINDTIAHLDLVAVTMAIAVVIGIGLGMLSYRSQLLSGAATTGAAALLTIPSLALLGILINIVGLGLTNVLIALVLYSLLPIVRNTIVGLAGVDSALVESARGMGMTNSRLMWRVRLPLAWPLILTGVRVSTQMIIGIAAIGAYVGGPGLGNQIFSGLARFGAVNSLNQVLIGTVFIIVLALLIDLLYVAIGRFTTPRGIRA
jgi:ABC-type proline/glycine betaine transport system permease subunit